MTLSTSDVAKVLRPNIVMRFDLTDGTSRTFEVPLARFHEMRRGVAVMLDEMDWAGDELDKANEIGARAMEKALVEIRDEGYPDETAMPTFEELKGIVGFPQYYHEEARYDTLHAAHVPPIPKPPPAP